MFRFTESRDVSSARLPRLNKGCGAPCQRFGVGALDDDIGGQRDRLGRGKPLSLRSAVELIRRPGKLLARVEAVHTRERRTLAQAEKAELHIYSDRIWAQHAGRAGRLKAEQAAQRAQQRDAHYAATRGVTLQMAKASLAADLQKTPANDHGGRAAEVKQRMAQWRAKNQGKDFGREL